MQVLERPVHALPAVTAPATRTGESGARRTLRAQIARLERELAMAATCAHPRLPLPRTGLPSPGDGPRLLSLGELEAVRDDLAARLRELRATRARIAAGQAAARDLLEQMLREPSRHRWVRVTNHDLGEPGCKSWHVRPRLGIVGMLAGWWHVKVSSGCPLASGPWHRLRPRIG